MCAAQRLKLAGLIWDWDQDCVIFTDTCIKQISHFSKSLKFRIGEDVRKHEFCLNSNKSIWYYYVPNVKKTFWVSLAISVMWLRTFKEVDPKVTGDEVEKNLKENGSRKKFLNGKADNRVSSRRRIREYWMLGYIVWSVPMSWKVACIVLFCKGKVIQKNVRSMEARALC